MFAVIFVVQPKADHWDDYLNLAKFLKPKLEAIDGFIDNERFESKRRKERILSLSTWRDEKAVVRWRTQGEHHGVQAKGRSEIFDDYHLSVGEIVHDTDPPAGLKVEEKRFDETESGAAKVATVTEIVPKEHVALPADPAPLSAHLGLDAKTEGLIDLELFGSIYNPGKLLMLGNWRAASAAQAWSPAPFDAARSLRHRRVRIIRDYGMFDRREAPQFYPEIKRSEAAD